MSFEDRKWVIINASDITDEMLNNAIQSGDLRKNKSEEKAVLKWNGDTPECFEGMTTYNHSEILEELSKSDWS